MENPSNVELLQEFMALRTPESALESKIFKDGSVQSSLLCGTEEELDLLNLAKSSDQLNLKTDGVLEFFVDGKNNQVQWVDAQSLPVLEKDGK